MTTDLSTPRLHWFAGRVHEVLDELTEGGVTTATLTRAEAAETVTALLRAAERIQGLALAVLPQADRLDVGAEATPVATCTSAWLAGAATVHERQAHRLTRLADDLEQTYPATASALLAGRIDAAQAQVITYGVEALPAWVNTDLRAKAETYLLDEAERLDSIRLRKVAKHLLVVIDPEGAEKELAKQVQREEDLARQETRFRIWDDGRGLCHGDFTLPTLHGAMLSKMLQAIASPQRPDAIERTRTIAAPRISTGATATGAGFSEANPPDAISAGPPSTSPGNDEGPAAGQAPLIRPRPTAEILGEAFCQLLERFPLDGLPTHGGVNASVVVTMDLALLQAGVGLAQLDTGDDLSAGQLRRLACAAGVIPAVLGTDSQVLDLGRKARLFNSPQRIAMGLQQDGVCAAKGCTRPVAWCDGHHAHTPWSQGGRTDLANGVLICPRHHTLAHHPDYNTEVCPDGRLLITKQRRRRT